MSRHETSHGDRYADMPAGLRKAIATLSSRHGVDPRVMMEIAKIESGGNGYRSNTRHGSMLGPWQFDPKTAKAYGLAPGERTHVWKSTEAAIELYKDNAEKIGNTLGRKPKPGEVFLGHLMGLGGAKKILKNPHRNAVAVRGHAAITGNGGTAKDTCGRFRDRWVSRFDEALKTPARSHAAAHHKKEDSEEVVVTTSRSPRRAFTALAQGPKAAEHPDPRHSGPSRTHHHTPD